MAISKKIIDRYLNQKKNNFDWIKSANIEELKEEIRYNFPEFNPKFEPFKHQYACILIGISNPQFNFFLDMGLGKTFVVLSLLQYYRKNNELNKTLVIVPNEINVLSWQDEIDKFTDFKSVALSGSSKKKLDLLNCPGDIFIVNYMGFLKLFRLSKAKETKYNKLDLDKIDSLLEGFNAVIFDEIHKLGNSKSMVTKLCDSLHMGIRYGLTGTPFGKSPEMLWSEFKVIDNGDTLGDNEKIFKEAFFTKSFNYFGQLIYTFKDKLSETLYNKIKNCSITYTTQECIDLPVLTKQVIRIPLTREGGKYYNQSFEGLQNELKDGQTSIENSFVRLRACCAGYLYIKDQNNKKIKSEFSDNPKLDHLVELLQSLNKEKVIVFNEYTLTGDLIESRLKKEKISYLRLYGATKNKKEVFNRFKDDVSIQVIILNSESGGTGSNLQYCRRIIFYESSVKPITRKQCEKRIHRIGQNKTTFVYDLVMKNTLEERNLECLANGENLYNSIIKGKIKL